MATNKDQNALANGMDRIDNADEQSEPPSLVHSLQSLSMAPHLPTQPSSTDNRVEAVTVTKQQILFSDMYDKDCSVVQELRLILDRKEEVAGHVLSLADQLEAPEIIKAKCRSNYSHSPSSVLINLPKVLRSKVEELDQKLKNMQRTDLTDILKEEKIPVDKQVEILLLKYPKVFERLTSMLDQRGPFNWKRLGQEYDIDYNQLDNIEAGTNSAERFLIDYAYKSVPRKDLKLSALVKHLSDLGREKEIDDLLKKINENDHSKSMTKVFAPNTDNMEELCKLLNKGSKGWQHLAEKWELDSTKYFWFIADKNASATEILLEWLMIKKPKFQVAELEQSLRSIGREDACEKLNEKFEEYVENSLR